MKRLDTPIDPGVAAYLDAVDGALAGEPVDPRHAVVAELALMLAAERPQLEAGAAQRLDRRVASRFAAPGRAAPATTKRRGRWSAMPLLATAGVALATVLAIVIVASVSAPGGVRHPAGLSAQSTFTSSTSAGSSASAVPSSPVAKSAAPTNAAPTSAAPTNAAPTNAAAASAASTPQPPSTGRKVVQSAQLALTAPANRLDAVAQEIFNVIGGENGIVNSSTVTQTGGPDGYAQLQLSIPSASLGTTMNRLSRLPYAHVSSRTDASQDVTDQYGADQRRLADARALRTSLLKQLAAATSSQEITSLQAQLKGADASISSDEATLRSLGHKIAYSEVTVSVNAGPLPVTAGGGFSIGRAAHDAGHVLTVAAGVALIVLAALVPVAALAALALWVGSFLRRRHRERALDLA
jgi:hypothetical protein